MDSGSVVELISKKLVNRLSLETYLMEEEWTLQLADDGYVQVQEYAWVPVNAAGVKAVVKAFILGDGLVYGLLLSKRWMHRVRAIEDHGAATLTIEGTDAIKRVLTGVMAESTSAELVGGPTVDEWEAKIAEDELEILAEELDNADYYSDVVKALR